MPEVIHVFSEQESKGSLLAEVHRLHNCLVVSSYELDAMRKARDFHGANSAYLMQERDRLERKGTDLCSAYGNELITTHDLREQVQVLREALAKIRNGVLLMVPEPQKSGFIEILAATESKP